MQCVHIEELFNGVLCEEASRTVYRMHGGDVSMVLFASQLLMQLGKRIKYRNTGSFAYLQIMPVQ